MSRVTDDRFHRSANPPFRLSARKLDWAVPGTVVYLVASICTGLTLMHVTVNEFPFGKDPNGKTIFVDCSGNGFVFTVFFSRLTQLSLRSWTSLVKSINSGLIVITSPTFINYTVD